MQEATVAVGEPRHAGTGREGRPAESAPEWLSVADLARRYQTSTRHIFRMADGGKLPWGMKLGQLRRWSRREIEEWEADGCRPVRSVKGAAR